MFRNRDRFCRKQEVRQQKDGLSKQKVEYSYSNTAQQYTVQIQVADDVRLFSSGANANITAAVSVEPQDLTDGYTLEVQLHRYFPEEQKYGNTASNPNVAGNAYTFNLRDPGSYCVVATVNRSDGYIVAKDMYYFIVQNEETIPEATVPSTESVPTTVPSTESVPTTTEPNTEASTIS